MAWDAARPVPWPRIVKLLAVYLVLVNVLIFLMGRRDYDVGVFLSTVAGGAIYLALTVVLVKFGWDPFAFGKRRPPRATTTSSTATATAPAKAKPPPTKRTNAGNPRAKRR